MSHDELINFCNNLALLLGHSIGIKANFKYYKEETDVVLVYISFDENNKELIRSKCLDFELNSEEFEYLNGQKAFKINSFMMEGDTLMALFYIDKRTISWYKFDENLINSIRSVNKFKL